jgi:hypothetical protein
VNCVPAKLTTPHLFLSVFAPLREPSVVAPRVLFSEPKLKVAMKNSHDSDRARAVLFGALAKFVVWSQGQAPQELLDEAERALAQAGTAEPAHEFASAA